MNDFLLEERAAIWPRRHALAVMAMSACCLPFADAIALSSTEAQTFKGGAWLLGDKLSLAALLYNQSASPALVDKFLQRARSIAGALHVSIPPFPPKAATQSESSATLIHYLIKGEGAQIGAALSRSYGDEVGNLYEVAVKSNLLILLYGPGDTLGRSIAVVISRRLSETSVPRDMWSGVVALIENRRPTAEVKDAVFKMHKDIANFYIPGSG